MSLARSLAAISPSTKRSRSAFGCSRPRFTRPRLFRTTAGEAEGTVADRGAAVHGAGARLRGAQAGGIGCRLVLQAATTRGRVGRRCQLQRRGSCSPFLLYRLSALELAPSFILGTSGDGADLRIEHDDCSFMRPDSDHARPPALDLSRWKDALRLDGPASWTQGPGDVATWTCRLDFGRTIEWTVGVAERRTRPKVPRMGQTHLARSVVMPRKAFQ